MKLRCGLASAPYLAFMFASMPGYSADECAVFYEADATLVGPDGPDVLRGTDGYDVIIGKGRNDLLIGFGGNDVFCGGDGSDIIIAGKTIDGTNELNGGAGDDKCYANPRDVVLNC